MPFPNVPEEIRDVFAKYYEALKEKYPDYSKERLAKMTWNIIKKLYYKGKDGKWHKKNKAAGWVYDDRNIDTVISFMLKPANIGGLDVAKDDLITIVSKASVMSLADVRKLDIFEKADQWKKTLVEKAGFNFDKVGDSLVEADYLYVNNWFCHAGIANENKALFLTEELAELLNNGHFTPQRPIIIDINHREVPALGFVLTAFLEEDPDTTGNDVGLKVISVLLNWGPYKEAGEKIIEADSKGELKFSMSCIPEYCECSQCGYLSRSRADSCEHVHDMENREALLIVHRPKFFTNSMILPPYKPADPDAKPNSISDNLYEVIFAGKTDNNNDKSKSTLTEEQMDDLEKLKQENKDLRTELEALGTEMKALKESEDAKTIEALKQDKQALSEKLEDASNKLASLEGKITETEATLKEVTQERDTLKADADKRIQDEKDARLDARKTQLEEFELTEESKVYFEKKAETEDDVSWNILMATLKATKIEDPKILASLQLQGLVGAGGKISDSAMAKLAEAVDNNI